MPDSEKLSPVEMSQANAVTVEMETEEGASRVGSLPLPVLRSEPDQTDWQGQFDWQLISVELEREAQAAKGTEAARLFHALGTIWEENLKQPKHAAMFYQKAFNEDGNFEPNIYSSRMLFGTTDRWDLESELSEGEASKGDKESVCAIELRNGFTFLHRLNDVSRAVASFEKAVRQSSPQAAESEKCIGGLLAWAEACMTNVPAVGGRERWRELSGIYRRLARLVSDREYASFLLARAGEIQFEVLGEAGDAAGIFKILLDEKPGNIFALKYLERIYSSTGERDKLAETLVREEHAQSDTRIKALACIRAADQYINHLKQEDKGVELLERCLEIEPGNSFAVATLGRIYDAKNKWTELAGLLRRSIEWSGSGDERILNTLNLAALLRHRMNDVEGAADCCLKVLEMDSANLNALQALDEIFTGLGDYSRLSELLERWVGVCSGDDMKTGLHLRLALIYDTRLQRPEKAAGHCISVLEIDGGNKTALELLDQVYRRSDDSGGLMSMCRHRLGIETDPEKIREIRMRLALLLAGTGAPVDDVIAELKEASGGAVAYLPALLVLREALRRKESYRELADVLKQIAGVASDPMIVSGALHEAADIFQEKLSEPGEAADLYLSAYELDTGNEELFIKAESVLESRGDWDRVAALCLKRADAKAGSGEEVQLLLKAGAIFEEKTGNPEAALEYYKRAALASPEVTYLMSVARVQMALGKWNDAAATLTLLTGAQGEGGSTGQAAGGLGLVAHRILGSIQREHLGDPVRAAEHFQKVLAVNPGDEVALEGMAKIFIDKKKWPEAIGLLGRLIAEGRERPKEVEYLLMLAGIYDKGYGDDVQTESILLKALETDCRNHEVLEHLCSIYKRRGDWNSLVGILDNYIAGVQPSDMKNAVPMMLRKGWILAGKTGDAGSAIDVYKKVLEIEPGNPEASSSIVGLKH